MSRLSHCGRDFRAAGTCRGACHGEGVGNVGDGTLEGGGGVSTRRPSPSDSRWRVTVRLPVSIYLVAPQGAELARIGVIVRFFDFPAASMTAPVDLRTAPTVGLGQHSMRRRTRWITSANWR